MDLPIYKIDSSRRYSLNGDVLTTAPCEDACVTGVGTLANKVVKYLLTVKGTDVLDPEYGSTLLSYTQYTRNELPRLNIEIIDALEKCTAYIRNNEVASQGSNTRLNKIELVKMAYGTTSSKDAVHVHIKIITQAGDHALLDIPVKAV